MLRWLATYGYSSRSVFLQDSMGRHKIKRPYTWAEFVELKMMQASPLVSPMFSVGCEGAGDVHEMVFLSKSKIWQTI
jgi:hypothetical protein